jgi:NAD-dependent dihydropyrimidine dehydrogenase PreA subunit
MPPLIDTEACIGCGTCMDICPLDCIYLEDDKAQVVYPEECWHCGACRQDCPEGAINYAFPLIMLNI